MDASLPVEEFFAQRVYRNLIALRSWDIPTSSAWSLVPHAEKASHALRPALDDIERSVVKTADPNVYEAPSPWHVALYCQMLQYHYSLSGSRLLFRGQRNHSWTLTPTILRKLSTVADETRNELFTAILSSISFNTVLVPDVYSRTDLFLKMSKNSYLAAAQHYGMNTYFLDFTTDPDVAVKFAASDKDSDDMASVLILTLESAEEHDLSIILPPPFVHRLHLQRGLFIKTEQTLDKERLGIREVRFPYQPSKRNPRPDTFEVLREGGTRVNILPRSDQLDEAMRATDAALKKGITAADVDDVESIGRGLKPHFSAVTSDPLRTWDEYIITFEETLYALVYNIDDHQQLSVDIERFTRIVATNLEVCCSIASLYRALPVQSPGQFEQGHVDRMSAMADLIEKIAAELGYDHAAAAAQHREFLGLPPRRA
jgi:FRG domain